MADLYSILAKAVAALDPNTKETRRQLYERARAALVAETGGLEHPEADFLAVLESLEDAIQELEAEALAKAPAQAPRERRIQRPAEPTTRAPRDDIVRASPGPVAPKAGQRFRQFARNLLQRPAERSDSLPGDLSNETDFDQAGDNWLSDVLARASRAEDEDDDGGRDPRRDGRRKR